MFGSFRRKPLKLLLISISLMMAQVSVGQDQTIMLRLQRSRATINTEATGGMEANGRNIYSLGASGKVIGVSSYPNSASCALIYNDGRFILEKRDEQTVGRPKVRTAEGSLGEDDLRQLKSILDSDELKKITDLTAPEPPAGAQALREAETMEVQINRTSAMQRFVAIKERFKTQAMGTSTVSSAPSTGMDTFLDNATAFRKTLNPLMKWFDGLEKKSKSSFKESKPQYCEPMTIG
jgi:hypothetical protein